MFIWSEDEFWHRIDVAAAKLGITTREVCRLAGVSEDAPSRRAKKGRRIDTILAIAYHAHLRPEDVLLLPGLKAPRRGRIKPKTTPNNHDA